MNDTNTAESHYKQYDGFRIYKSFTALLGSEPSSKEKQTIHCPFCHKDRSEKNKRKRELSVIQKIDGNGSYKCNHCGEKGYINPKLFSGKKYERPAVMAQDSSAMSVWGDAYAKRGIGIDVLRKYGVVFAMHGFNTAEGYKTKPGRFFPYTIGGQLISYKIRSVEKDMTRSAGTALTYGGISQLPMRPDYLVIVEGEEDLLITAQAIEQKGLSDKIGVVTVPNGFPKTGRVDMGFHDLSWHYIENKINENTKIIIASDNDEAGQNGKLQVSDRIGKERCYTMSFGGAKDPNDMYLAKGPDKLVEAIQACEPLPVKEVVKYDEVSADVWDVLRNGRKPFDKIYLGNFDKYFTWKRGGQSSLFSAPRQTAKSELMFNIAVRLAALHGWKFAILSPESGEGSQIYEALIEVALGKHVDKNANYGNNSPQATEDDLMLVEDFIRKHFVVINPFGFDDLNVNTILDAIKDQKRKFGIDGYIIDPVNSIPNFFDSDNNVAVKLVATLSIISKFNLENNLHGIWVAHPKNIDVKKMMAVNDVFGGSAWGARFDNICFMKRCYDTSSPAQNVGDDIEILTDKFKSRNGGKSGLHPEVYKYHIPSRRFGTMDMSNGQAKFLDYKDLLAMRLSITDFEVEDLPL